MSMKKYNFYIYNTQNNMSYIKSYLIDVLDLLDITDDWYRHLPKKEENQVENETTKMYKEYEITVYKEEEKDV